MRCRAAREATASSAMACGLSLYRPHCAAVPVGTLASVLRQAGMAAGDAAVDALDFASWTVWQAELTVLDAIDARARADERAAASGTR
jgi:hypothetical protein